MIDVRIIGNLTRDPDLRVTPDGENVCSLTVACNFKRKGQAKVLFVKVTVWGKNAENCGKFLKKGSKVYVDGGLDVDEYKKDGENRFVLEIYEVKRVEFCSYNDGGVAEFTRPSGDSGVVDEQSGFASVETDELPF